MESRLKEDQMNDCVIFDIDGTLADCEHRRVHLTGGKKNWAAFNAAMGDDTPNVPVVRLARMFAASKMPIMLCTGREEDTRRLTETWLGLHEVPFTRLYMRAPKDYRADDVVNGEMLADIRRCGWQPWLVVDDRASVTRMWRAAGLVCLQCAEGDF